MPITCRFRAEGDLLIVEASGRDDGLEDVHRYGMAILAKAASLRTTRILCDERALDYDLDISATFESARLLAGALAQHVPGCARAALVPSPRYLSEARFWSTVAVHRGLTIRAFAELEDARAWLAEEA
ncbi:MAG: hypothetical protein H6Q00_1770 [Holophagaceae bacterium]|nr:hypothetical protein [Holophagaceae bacterium]